MAAMMDYAGGGMPPMNGDMAAAGPPGMGMPGGMPGGMEGGMPGGPAMGGEDAELVQLYIQLTGDPEGKGQFYMQLVSQGQPLPEQVKQMLFSEIQMAGQGQGANMAQPGAVDPMMGGGQPGGMPPMGMA